MKYFSEKTVSSLPIPTHLDFFDLLPLRVFGRAWKFIMFLKLVILILLQKKENQRHSQSITEFHVWGVGNRVGNYLVEGRK